MRELLFSITAKDCEWEYSRGSGEGGQKRNKTSNAVRVKHAPSGAIGRAEDTRSQRQNRKLAFKRMAESPRFQAWVEMKAAGVTIAKCKIDLGRGGRDAGAVGKGLEERIDEKVGKMIAEENLKIEIWERGRWIENERNA